MEGISKIFFFDVFFNRQASILKKTLWGVNNGKLNIEKMRMGMGMEMGIGFLGNAEVV